MLPKHALALIIGQMSKKKGDDEPSEREEREEEESDSYADDSGAESTMDEFISCIADKDAAGALRAFRDLMAHCEGDEEEG